MTTLFLLPAAYCSSSLQSCPLALHVGLRFTAGRLFLSRKIGVSSTLAGHAVQEKLVSFSSATSLPDAPVEHRLLKVGVELERDSVALVVRI